MSDHKPPFELTSEILELCASINREIGRLEGAKAVFPSLKLRRTHQVKTIQASLVIEGNTLTIDQITALLDGKRVIGPKKDILEAQNALNTYALLEELNPLSLKSLLKAHLTMMRELIESPGKLRTTNVGIFQGQRLAHMAPPSKQIPRLMNNLFHFLKSTKEMSYLLKSCICHYELEFIHPFVDGNGRIGRLWQQLLLIKEHSLFRFIVIEELIRENQNDYYKVLGQSDREGSSTPFIVFILKIIQKALHDYRPSFEEIPNNSHERLQYAHHQFQNTWFARKDYLHIFPEISSATASRDLKDGLDDKLLIKEGDHNKIKYKYS